MRLLCLSACVLALSGCATTSFAPPVVNLHDKLYVRNTQTFTNGVCSPRVDTDHPAIIEATREGALTLIDNFLLTYRCQRDRAAEGRQFFDIPQMLIMVGAATAAALGAGPNVAILAGASAATLAQGKSYYAPQDKFKVLNDAMKALDCIRSEAVGIDAPAFKAISDVEATTDKPKPPETPQTVTVRSVTGTLEAVVPNEGISVSSEAQYYGAIWTALLATETVVADRLSAAGSPFDSKGVIAEIEAIQDKIKKAETQQTPEQAGTSVANTPPPPQVAPTGTTEAMVQTVQKRQYDRAIGLVNAYGKTRVGQAVIDLKTLRPKLDRCVVNAKV